MKKYSIKLLALLTSAILLGSCSDFLDTDPTNRVPSNEIQTIRDLEKIVNGFYLQMKWNDYYGTPIMVLGETRADDFKPRRSTGGFQQIHRYDFTTTNYSYGGIWDKAYNVIMNTNFLLTLWDGIPANTQDEIDRKNNVKGQLYTVRAFCHFDIVRLYCYPYLKDNGASLGAVIGDKVFGLGEQKARATVKETYDFVIGDLTEALTYLSSDYSKEPSPGNFNYWGAKGLLARVYLYKGDYDNAFKHADEILTDPDNPYRLNTNLEYVAAWGQQDAPETMLELKVTIMSNLDDNGGVDSWYYVVWHGPGFAAGNLVPTKKWFDLLDQDPDDVRHGLIETRYPDPEETPFTPFKWLAKFPGYDKDFKKNNPMIMRLTEIYLIAAEAALKKSTPDQAKANQYLNAIRLRANPALTNVTATEDLVLDERRKEFIGEGHRYFDLARLGKTIDRTYDNSLPGTNAYKIVDPWNVSGTQHKVILPISNAQRLANPLADQNPGY
ncbi:MAG: RagB/SusD family nutrient uptake outer membrane protein [Prevotellaceae bacterium]|jgi:tetratricopeptide (TPR) repeat protein|nr:RagB/SusD family nutrient uptake outer membrane protein [Prevotellaceae bacterium]